MYAAADGGWYGGGRGAGGAVAAGLYRDGPPGCRQLQRRAGLRGLHQGPLDLFLNTLARHGSYLDEELTVHLRDDAPIDLRYDAIQRVKNGLVGAGSRSATRQLAARRPTVQGCEEIDEATYTTVMPQATVEDKGLLRVLLAAGVWTGKFLYAAGQLESPRCPFCGAAVEDLEHMWFDCPHNQDLREGKPLFLPEVRSHLPACLRNYGIAPACGPRPGQALWPADEGAMTNQAARVLLAAMPEGYVATAIDSYIAECGGGIASARHLASHLRDGPHLQAPVVSRVFEPAPAAINSYSDGSVQLPGLFGRGGSGAWWPCRSGRPSQAETNFAHVLEEARGLALAAALRTPLLSSTRTEILGVAMAMLHEGGVHVGVDNWPAIRNIRQLLRVKAADREAFYAKVKNGDLLRLVANIESQRGPGSVVLTKVKAHTDAAEAAAGAISATHRAGNDKADRVAKAAADMQEQPGTLALKALHQRHQVLIGIVRSFQQLMFFHHEEAVQPRGSQDHP